MLPGWNFDVADDRGWLCVQLARVSPDGDDTRLADALVLLSDQRTNRRLLIEFADGQILTSLIAGQLVLLHKRLHLKGGMLRLCRLSAFNRDVLRLMGVLDRFQVYPDRSAAVHA